MRKLALTLIFLLISSPAFAEFGRSTTFDDRDICERDKGVWHTYGNSAADNCEDKMDRYSIAAQVLTYACDCGKGRCWSGDRCVLMSDFKKDYDLKQAEQNKKMEEARRVREQEYHDNANSRLKILIDQTKTAAPQGGKNGQAAPPNNNNMAQFYDKLPQEEAPVTVNNVASNASQQAQNIADQSTKAAEKIKQGGLGKLFSLPQTGEGGGTNNSPAPPTNSTSASPTPFFLQQQAKAQQEAVAKTTTPTTTTPDPSITQVTPTTSLPELPQIPLPQ